MRATSRVLLLALGCACGGERTTQESPMPTATAPAAELVLTYEGMTLGAPLDELIATAAARGWQQNAQPAAAADQTVTVFPTPDHPVERYKLGYERGVLLNIQIEFRTPDPARVALRERFAVSRHLRGVWFMSDAGRQVLASVDDRGATMRALHVGRMRDRREAEAMLRVTLDAEANGQK